MNNMNNKSSLVILLLKLNWFENIKQQKSLIFPMQKHFLPFNDEGGKFIASMNIILNITWDGDALILPIL